MAKGPSEASFDSVSHLAWEIGLDVAFAATLLRLTLLAPDIVEAVPTGNEPSGLAGRSLGEVWLSLTMLTKQLPAVWTEQKGALGFCSATVGRSYGLDKSAVANTLSAR